MTSKFPFSIIRFEPSQTRGERVNVGIVVFRENNVDVRIDANHPRLTIIKEYGSVDELFRLEKTLSYWASAAFADGGWEEAYKALTLSSHWTLSGLGCFYASAEDEYEIELRAILDDLVSPVGSSRTTIPKRRLVAELRDEFEKIRLLGSTESDFELGYAVPRYPITIGTSTLKIDFALQGKEVFLLQTIDLSASDASEKIREVSLKSLLIDRARSNFSKKVHAIFVVRWSSIESEAQDTCKSLIEAYADSIVDFENDRHKMELLSHLAKQRNKGSDLFKSNKNQSSYFGSRALKIA